MDHTKYLILAKEITLQVGEYLTQNFGLNKAMSHKGGTHYSIKEDEIANEMYVKFFNINTPDATVYTEEGDQKLSQFTWVIDPLEGTSNYRVGIPLFATQCALMYDGIPFVSVIYLPQLNQTFTAMKGKGAYLNETKISVSSVFDLKLAMACIGKGTDLQAREWYSKTVRKVTPKIRTIRSFGATGIEMAYCAAGKVDLCLNNGSQLYDYLPGALLIRESGGVVLNEKGRDWTIYDKYLIASNKNLASHVIELL